MKTRISYDTSQSILKVTCSLQLETFHLLIVHGLFDLRLIQFPPLKDPSLLELLSRIIE